MIAAPRRAPRVRRQRTGGRRPHLRIGFNGRIDKNVS
jgi:hypothetical protein